MIGAPRVPAVWVGGRRHASNVVEATALDWLGQIHRAASGSPGAVAVALSGDENGVALFAAMTARPGWFVLLPPDARVWDRLGIPASTHVILPPGLRDLAEQAGRIGLRSTVLESRATGPADAGALPLFQNDGVVLFTSGSTGAPKPVYRTTRALLAGVIARLSALELQPGDGLVAGVALGHGHGLTRLLSAMCLGGPFALLAPLDHRAALAVLAQPEFAFWSATAHFADVLGRCRLTGPARVPRICLLSSPVAASVRAAFLERFGVPLRQNYSSTETGVVATDWGAPEEVCGDTVGRPLHGVEVRVGDAPDDPRPAGEVGRIWVRSPWQMEGYGFPPQLERPWHDGGWLPTRDLGAVRADGRIALAGRLDDCIRTREGRLVNLESIAERLRGVDGIDDAAVVPLAGASGASFGAILVCAAAHALADVRSRVAEGLPEWAWPRAVVQAPALPRLPSGKLDRQRCIAMLQEGT